jgi:hypothetical protein
MSCPVARFSDDDRSEALMMGTGLIWMSALGKVRSSDSAPLDVRFSWGQVKCTRVENPDWNECYRTVGGVNAKTKANQDRLPNI